MTAQFLIIAKVLCARFPLSVVTQKLFIFVFYTSLHCQSTFQSKELCSMFRTPEVRSYFSSLDLWIYNSKSDIGHL